MSDARDAAIARIVTTWREHPEAVAAAVVDAAAVLGSADEWDSDTPDGVSFVLDAFLSACGLPSVSDTDTVAYWEDVTDH